MRFLPYNISDPINLSIAHSDKFIIYERKKLNYFNPKTCTFISDKIYDINIDKIIETTNIDQPNMQFIIDYKLQYFRLYNTIQFSTLKAYNNIFKKFKVNNSSWIKMEFSESTYTTYIHFSTPLDMMAVCNELFTNINKIVIWFSIDAL